jgi:kynurenine formamidase
VGHFAEIPPSTGLFVYPASTPFWRIAMPRPITLRDRPGATASLLVAALLLVGCTTPPEPRPGPNGRLVDLTHAFGDDTLYWPTAPGFALHTDFEGETEGGWFYESNTLRTSEHGGTHLDAPVHFAEGRSSTDEIPLERLVAAAVVIDVSAACAADRDHAITLEELEAWEAEHGRIPDASIVLFRTGFDRHWPDAEAYLGTARRGAEGVAALHFPGLSPDAARWLAERREIAAVGIDTASLDPGRSKTFEAHRILFAREIPGFENVAGLGALPPVGATVIALPMKIRSGSGGPLRIIAVLP